MNCWQEQIQLPIKVAPEEAYRVIFDESIKIPCGMSQSALNNFPSGGSMTDSLFLYGRGDSTFEAVGREQGVRALVDRFYDIMSAKDRYQKIWGWHPDDKQLSRDKLYTFLCGWMGGPSKYAQTYGKLNIMKAHSHLNINAYERDLWLDCMGDAMADLCFSKPLSDYLIQQLSMPAERIRQVSQSGINRSVIGQL